MDAVRASPLDDPQDNPEGRTGIAPAGVPAPAWRPVLLISAAAGLLLLVTSGLGGLFGDELYFVRSGYHLSWGYADGPPLISVLGRATDTLFGHSRIGIRLPVTLSGAATVVVGALTAREFGGGRSAQVRTALTVAVSLGLVGISHLFTTAALDPFFWSLITWLLVRWTRTRRDRVLVWVVLATVLSIETKYLVAGLWAMIVVGVLIAGPRDLLRRPVLWAGGLVTVLVALPGLVWQAHHGWPQLDMTRVIANEQTASTGGRPTLLPLIVLSAGLPAGSVIFAYGLWQLVRSTQLRAYRFLGLASVLVILAFLISGGRQTYAAGLFPLAFAAGWAVLEQRPAGRRWAWSIGPVSFVITAVIMVVGSFPVLPTDQEVKVSITSRGSTGWPELARVAADAQAALPVGQRATTALLADTYWQAAALEQYGPEDGLGRVYSPERGYWYFGHPADTDTDALFVSADARLLEPHFDACRAVGQLENPNGYSGINDDVSVWLCTGIHEPWSRLWPQLQHNTSRPLTF